MSAPPRLMRCSFVPDGYVAWVAGPNETDQDSERSLTKTLNKWFGEANEAGEQNRPSAAA
jgi:hypothetical protein